MSSQALCVKLSVLFGVVCHYFTKKTDMASKQRQAFRMCVLPCRRYLNRGGINTFFVLPVWEKSMRWLWALRRASLTDAPIPPGVLSQEDAQSCIHRGSGSSGGYSPGVHNGSVSGVKDEHSLISTLTWQVQCLLSVLGSTCCGFLRSDWGTDTSTIWFWGIRCL